MASEQRNDTIDTLELLWTELLAEENVSLPNTTNSTDTFWDYEFAGYTVILTATIIICICGMVGNGIVVWLLGFRIKRNHYGVYILNLAIADFTYLLSTLMRYTPVYTIYNYGLYVSVIALFISSYIMGLLLLMVISVERCVSVLWPIWYKCHRPKHLSTIVCALIWVLLISFSLVISIFYYLVIESTLIVWMIYTLISLPIFLVLFVASLTLFFRVQCYSQQRKPSRLYWTILLNVLVFLLLNVPNSVYLAGVFSMGSTLYTPVVIRIMTLLAPFNSAVNPIIYFFIGRHRQRKGRKPLQEVLQRALMDDDEEFEQRRGRTP